MPDEPSHIADLEAESGLEPLVLDVSERAAVREPRMSTSQAISYYGKRDSKFIVDQTKTVATLAYRELIRRLMKDPEQFKAAELNFIAGTAVDKVSKKERWEKADDGGAKNWLDVFATTIASVQADTTLKLSLEVSKAGQTRVEEHFLPVVQTVDVPYQEEHARPVPDHG